MSPPPHRGAPDSAGGVDRAVEGTTLVFFDGVCGLCNRFVDLVLRRDRAQRFRFAPLQGTTAARVLHGVASRPASFDSLVVLLANGQRLVRAQAVLFVLSGLPAPWRWLAVLRIVPRRLADASYDWLARRRYRVFGRKDSCRVPTEKERERFLD